MGERRRETSVWERNVIHVTSHECPKWGPAPQPRQVPALVMELVTLHFAGQCPTKPCQSGLQHKCLGKENRNLLYKMGIVFSTIAVCCEFWRGYCKLGLDLGYWGRLEPWWLAHNRFVKYERGEEKKNNGKEESRMACWRAMGMRWW